MCLFFDNILSKMLIKLIIQRYKCMSTVNYSNRDDFIKNLKTVMIVDHSVCD